VFNGRGSGLEKLMDWMLVELAFGCPYSERLGMNGEDLVTVVVLEESLSSLETDCVLARLLCTSIGELSEGLLGEEVIV
jgi:hypothetical protein